MTTNGPVELTHVDSFTDRPFAGNPAAVCILDDDAPEGWMQDVATEMNLSETAFLVEREDEGWDLRWFTPAAEVDLCGHATLASAHVLWEKGRIASDREAVFHTASGVLRAWRRDDGWIEMDFPAEPPVECEPPDGLLEAIGAAPVLVARNRLDLLVLLTDETALRALRPDFGRLKALSSRGVIATAPASDPSIDFVSRYFAPAFGIDEDPVTGSAHCCLGPFWAERLGRGDTLTGFQASARGGVVRVRPNGDRVTLSGQAITVMNVRMREGASCVAPLTGHPRPFDP